MKYFAIAALCCALTAGCVSTGGFAPKVVAKQTVDRSFSFFRVPWRNAGVETVLAYKLINQAGVTAVCVAWGDVGKSSNNFEFSRLFIADASVAVEGRRIIRGLSFGSKVAGMSQPQDIVGTSASCGQTGSAWQPSYASAKPKIESRRRFTINE